MIDKLIFRIPNSNQDHDVCPGLIGDVAQDANDVDFLARTLEYRQRFDMPFGFGGWTEGGGYGRRGGGS